LPDISPPWFFTIMSDGAKYITGTKTAIDGGWTTIR
jgi:hypothetical protein